MSTALLRPRVLVPAALVYVLALALLIGWTRTPATLPRLPFWFGHVMGQIALGDWFGSALRPPIIPWFMGAVWWLGGGTIATVVVKNLLLQPLYLFSLYRFASLTPARAAAGVVLVFALTCPLLIINGFALVPAEGWLIPLLAFVVVYLLYPDHDFSLARTCLVGLTVALLLSKSSMRFLCPVLVVLFAVRYPDRRVAATIAVFVLAAFAGWGAYNYAATGEVRFACEGDGYNLYKGNNPLALDVYPADLDHTSGQVNAQVPVDFRLRRWDSYDYFVDRTFDFWRSNPAAAYRLFMLRFYAVFVAVAPVEIAIQQPVDLTVRLISALYVLLFRVALFFGLLYALIQLSAWTRDLVRGRIRTWRPDERVAGSLVFLGVTLGFVAPYLVSMAWERHIMPLFIPTLFFAVWILEKDGDRIRSIASHLLPPAPGGQRNASSSASVPMK